MPSILSEAIIEFILKECGESRETDKMLETIQFHANKIYISLIPILKDDKDLLIVLRCSKPS